MMIEGSKQWVNIIIINLITYTGRTVWHDVCYNYSHVSESAETVLKSASLFLWEC